MNIASWFFFGFLAGLIVHLIDPDDVSGGLVGTVLTGIIGALSGGFLTYNLFGGKMNGFDLSSFVVAVAGALALAAIERISLRDDKSNRSLGLKGGRSRRMKEE